MPETDDLELQQYQRQYWEEDVPVADVRKSALRKFVYLGSGLFVLLMLAGALIKFPDEVSLPFVLKSDMPEDIYRFPYPVYLVQKYAASGSKVAPGTPLVKITSPEIVSMINACREAEQQLANYNKRNPGYLGNQKEMLRIRMAENNRHNTEAQQQLSIQSSTWQSNEERLKFELEDAEKRLAQNRKLYEGKYISAVELKEYETRRIRAADALVTARRAYEKERTATIASTSQYALENTSLNREIEQASIGSSSDSITLANRLMLAKEKIGNTFGAYEISEGNLILKAADNGLVSFLFEGDKEVPGSAIMLKVMHRATLLYSAAVSPPTLIGKMDKRQVAYLKVATFPSYEWGAVKGHIESVSLTPDEKGNFNVKIVLDDLRKLQGRLQPGMNGTLAVQLGERTFFQYFFRNLKKTTAALSADN